MDNNKGGMGMSWTKKLIILTAIFSGVPACILGSGSAEREKLECCEKRNAQLKNNYNNLDAQHKIAIEHNHELEHDLAGCVEQLEAIKQHASSMQQLLEEQQAHSQQQEIRSRELENTATNLMQENMRLKQEQAQHIEERAKLEYERNNLQQDLIKIQNVAQNATQSIGVLESVKQHELPVQAEQHDTLPLPPVDEHRTKEASMSEEHKQLVHPMEQLQMLPMPPTSGN